MTHTENATETRAALSDDDELATLSLSTTFELLKNRRRRDTLAYLLEHDGRSTLSDLAEHIAALENGIDVAQLSSDQRKRVYIGLYQCHLPKMDGAGVIEFDKHRGTVVLQEEAHQLTPYLEAEAAAPNAGATTGAAPAEPSTLTTERLVRSALVAGVVGFVVLALLSAVVPYALGGLWLGAAVGIAAVLTVGVVRDRLDLSGALRPVAEPER